MKKLSIVAGAFILFAVGIWILPGDNPQQTDSSSYFAKYRQYRMKNRKMPRSERRPNEWFYRQRAYPNASISAGKQLAAIEAAKEIRASQQGMKTLTYDPWQNAGPTNIPGRITDIAAHPSDPYTVYAAAAAGGVWKANYLGDEWHPLFDDVGVQSMGAIAIDPEDPNIIWAGTGEQNNAGDNYEGTGVYKSTDGGLTWNYMGLPNSYHIGRIVLDPWRPDTAYVAVNGKLFGTNPERGVYMTTDGGSSWEQKLFVSDSTACIDIAVYNGSIIGDNIIMAAMMERYRTPADRKVGGMTSGIWRSTDNGANWEDITGTGGLPPHSTDMGRIGLSFDSKSPSRGYILISNDPGDFVGIYAGTIDGNSWEDYDPNSYLNNLNGSWSGGWYFSNVRHSYPPYEDRVYALGLDLYRRDSYYNTAWYDIRNGQHVDMHAMWIDPGNPDFMYCGNDGGVYHSTDNGDSWTILDQMASTQFYAIEINPRAAYRMYGGTQDNGSMQGTTMNFDLWDQILGGDGFYVVVDYYDTKIIYAEYQNGYLMKSTNDGVTWNYAMNGIDYNNDRHEWTTPIVMDPHNHMVLYYGSQKLYRTTDGAENWTPISGDLTKGEHPGILGLGCISTIDVSRVNMEIIWVGTDDGNVQVTTNGGTDWNLRTTSLPDRWVTRVTCDPFSENIAYVTLSGYKDGLSDAHIYRTTDYGMSWTPIDGDLPDVPVNDILVDYHDYPTLYIGTDVGVFYSENTGTNWTLMSDGIPIVPVNDIDFQVPERTLAAGTHGRSIYYTKIDCPGVVDSDNDGTPDECDNCPSDSNAQYWDADYDYIGDACDECTDIDGDGYGDPGYAANTCPEDNCPEVYNPDQTDSNGDGIGDACNYRQPEWDTVSTSCLNLVVGCNGNFGDRGTDGGQAGMTMDYSLSGDCDPNALMYMFDGSPLLNYYDGGDWVVHYSQYFNQSFVLVTDRNWPVPTVTTAEYDVYETGTFVTPDYEIALEKTWWAPKNPDSCTFIIQRLRIYSYDGASHSGLNICEAIDWDLPNDNSPTPTNYGGFDAASRMLYIQGYESDGSGCQPNDNRYAAMAMMAYYINDESTIDSSAAPYSGYVVDNTTYIYPYTGWNGMVTNILIQNTGYGVMNSPDDMSMIMTYFYDYTLDSADTLNIYTVLTTVQNGTGPTSPDKATNDLTDNIAKAKQWTDDHVISLSGQTYVCGDANGDGQPNVGDAVYLIAYVFKGGPAPDPLCLGDANGDGNSNVGDAVYLISYVFKGGPPPVEPCCR